MWIGRGEGGGSYDVAIPLGNIYGQNEASETIYTQIDGEIDTYTYDVLEGKGVSRESW